MLLAAVAAIRRFSAAAVDFKFEEVDSATERGFEVGAAVGSVALGGIVLCGCRLEEREDSGAVRFCRTQAVVSAVSLSLSLMVEEEETAHLSAVRITAHLSLCSVGGIRGHCCRPSNGWDHRYLQSTQYRKYVMN